MVHFYEFLALLFLKIAQERTAQNENLSVRSSLFALFLIERHHSQNQGSLKSKERFSDFKERCAQLCYLVLATPQSRDPAVLLTMSSQLRVSLYQKASHTGLK